MSMKLQQRKSPLGIGKAWSSGPGSLLCSALFKGLFYQPQKLFRVNRFLNEALRPHYPVVLTGRRTSLKKGLKVDACLTRYAGDHNNRDLFKTGIPFQIREQGYSLNPGRYVGVAEKKEDDVDFEEQVKKLTEEFKGLTGEARGLEKKIIDNM